MDVGRSSEIPAIVFSRGFTALGALRCLAMNGIETYVAPFDELASHSRWYRPLPATAHAWPTSLHGAQADAALAALPFERAVAIAGADDAALWLADVAAGPLGQRFPYSGSSRATYEIVQDKSKFADWLAQTRIPHPRTFRIESRADLDAVPFDEMERVFLKPADSQSFTNALGKKGVWAHSRAQMIESWQQLHDLGFRVVVQEYVAGDAADHYFIDGFRDRNGNVVGLFARRRLRIYPPGFGNSSYCESVPIAEVEPARQSLEELLAALSYRGIFSAEFKRDARTGAFRILEVNSRAWWYVEFAARCGLNVCTMAYRDALGLPVDAPDEPLRIGVGCLNWISDAKAVASREGRLGAPLTRVLRQWSRAHYHVWRLDDPMPGIRVFLDIVRRRVRRLFTRKR